MKYPFLASFIVFCLVLMNIIRKSRNKEAAAYNNFMEEEARANSTRRQPLDDLNYITIDFNTLPMDILSDDEKVIEYHETLKTLSDKPIVNLTGLTNTELKLKYGAPNIDLLSSYDNTYTILARTLNDWGKYAFDQGYTAEAQTILEFAMETGTDVSESFLTLAQIYHDAGQNDKIKELTEKASQINSLLSKSLVQKLENFA